jgi:hypothetical protein
MFWFFGGGLTPLISVFSDVPFLPFGRASVNSFQKHHQISSFYLNWLVFSVNKTHIWKTKFTDLQLLCENGKAVLVKPKNLDEVALPAAKQKQVAGERVLVDEILDERKQAVKGSAHVGRLGANEDSHRWRKIEHYCTPTSEITEDISFIEQPSATRKTIPLRKTISIEIAEFDLGAGSATSCSTIRSGAKSMLVASAPASRAAASLSESRFRQLAKFLSDSPRDRQNSVTVIPLDSKSEICFRQNFSLTGSDSPFFGMPATFLIWLSAAHCEPSDFTSLLKQTTTR